MLHLFELCQNVVLILYDFKVRDMLQFRVRVRSGLRFRVRARVGVRVC